VRPKRAAGKPEHTDFSYTCTTCSEPVLLKPRLLRGHSFIRQYPINLRTVSSVDSAAAQESLRPAGRPRLLGDTIIYASTPSMGKQCPLCRDSDADTVTQ
jgi:DNA-directed RNA polymerase subunit RPC12/RpoP